MAEACEMVMGNSKAIERLAKEKPGLAKRIADWLHEFFSDIRKAFEGVEARHEEAKAMLDYMDELTKLWDDALVEAVENRGSGKNAKASGSHAKMEIREIGDTGKYYVKADRQVLYGNDPKAWGEQLTRYINKHIRNGEDVILTANDGELIKLTSVTAEKGAFRNVWYDKNNRAHLLTDEEYAAKLNAEAHIDEIVKVSEDKNKEKPNRPDEKNLHGNFAKDGWRYREAYFTDFDGKHYQLTLSVAYGQSGKVAYNIANMKERSFPQIHGPSNPKTGAQGGKASSDETVPQKEPNVKQSRRENDEEDLRMKYPNLNLNEDISDLDGIPAIELTDGSVLPIKDHDRYPTHVSFIEGNRIDVDDLRSGGWIGNGVYDPSFTSDTARYIERQQARKRVAELTGKPFNQFRFSRRDSAEGLTKEEARAQAAAYTRLKAENAELQRRVEYWKGQTQRTKQATVRQTAPTMKNKAAKQGSADVISDIFRKEQT